VLITQSASIKDLFYYNDIHIIKVQDCVALVQELRVDRDVVGMTSILQISLKKK
jgi:hypothetical protein